MDEIATKLAGHSWVNLPGENISFLPAGFIRRALPSPSDVHRAKFGLSGPGKDYVLFHALRLIHAIRDLPERLGEKHSSVELHRWNPPETSWTGAIASRVGNCGPHVLYFPSAWPVALSATLAYKGPRRGMLAIGSRTEEINVNPANGNLYPEWPSWSGISCSLRTQWLPGVTVEIKFTPASFPAESFVDTLSNDSDILVLLETSGFVDEFSSAGNAEQKSAFLFAGLAYATKLDEEEPVLSWIPCGNHEQQ